jgi:maleate isomerase
MHNSVAAQHEPSWVTLECRLEMPHQGKKTLGLIALAGDCHIERELRRLVSFADIEIFTTRIPIAGDRSTHTLSMLRTHISDASGRISPGDQLDFIAFGCTSGAAAIGPQQVSELIKAARPNSVAFDPISSAIAAMHSLSVRNIALVTPYSSEINQLIVSRCNEGGLLVKAGVALHCRASRLLGHTPPTRIAPRDIRAAVLECCRYRDIDAVFVSCTGLQCCEGLSRHEAWPVPIVTSNSALAWRAMSMTRQVGYIHRYSTPFNGRLMET